jgi:hypothetical protein
MPQGRSSLTIILREEDVTDHVLAELAKRRAELAGEAEALRARLARIATDLGHPDAVIRQFDPDFDTATIRPKRARAADATSRGETCRFVLDVLRRAAAPMTTAAIAARLIAERSLDRQGRQARRRVMGCVGLALRRQRKNGTVQSIPGPGPGPFVLWEIVR